MEAKLRAEAARAGARRFPIVPASFFGMVLGLLGLAAAWKAAAGMWQVSEVLAAALTLAGTIVWAAVLLLFLAKWVLSPEAARSEARDPIQCCFIGLAGVATNLVSIAVLPQSRAAGFALFALGTLFTISFAAWKTGGLWQGGRDASTNSPVLYLPTVAGGFVAATAAAAQGFPMLSQLAFGAGFFSWLAIESVLLNRLYTGGVLALPLRPTLGIQLAPPAVGAVAVLSAFGDGARPMAAAMLGYALLQALVLLRLLPWIAHQTFVTGYWGFAFGATALGTVTIRLAENAGDQAFNLLAGLTFGAANLVVAALIIGTARLALQGRLLESLATRSGLDAVEH